MEQTIEFFLAPYRSSDLLSISLEILAVVFGIASVIYAKKEKIAVYPTGIISTSIYVYICLTYQLYGDFIINLYYTAMSIYGWVLWSKMGDDHIDISTCSKKDWLKALIIFISTAILVIGIYLYFDRFNQFTDYTDTFTTGIFFAAMWLMANKKIEHWWLWIIGNTLSIPLYFIKGLGLTGIQYLIFLILAIQGFYAWKNKIENS